jgi:thiamine biosynthesis lipoprotein
LDLAIFGSNDAATAESAIFAEITRLTKILSTRDPQSAISRGASSHEIDEVLAAYEHWQRQTGGAISAHIGGKLNIDALGKSYIIDRALRAVPHASVLLNIGGDIAVRGRSRTIGIVDGPDNSEPITHVRVFDGAVATSGTSERGAHIIDPRTNTPARGARNVTVIAKDSVTANALATACCVLSTEEGLRLVDRTDGGLLRSARFSAFERSTIRSALAVANWPAGFELAVTVTLKELQSPRAHRPYLAVWAEDASGKLVRSIAVWANKPRWMPELHTWWSQAGASDQLFSITKPTRPPGRYRIAWDGLDDQGHPVPEGTYRIVVETNREHGDYAKEAGTIECGAKPGKISLKATGEFEDVPVEYGPRPATS